MNNESPLPFAIPLTCQSQGCSGICCTGAMGSLPTPGSGAETFPGSVDISTGTPSAKCIAWPVSM